MRKKIFVLLCFSCLLVSSCFNKLFSNDTNTPQGFDKINFSSKQNPSEMTRNPLEYSEKNLNYGNSFLESTIQNKVLDINLYNAQHNTLVRFFDSDFLQNFIASIPNFSPNQFGGDVLIYKETPETIFNSNIINKEGVLDKYSSDKISINSNLEKYLIFKFDNSSKQEDIDFSLSSMEFKLFYARNLYPTWKTEESQSKSSWQYLVVCAKANVFNKNKNNYTLNTWPIVNIITLNPNNSNSINYITLNNLINVNNNTENFSVDNINLLRKTARYFAKNTNGFAFQSSINDEIYIKNYSFSYFQEAMSFFYSQFKYSEIENNLNKHEYFFSWQPLNNKSYLDYSINFPYDKNTTSVKTQYFNKYNNIVDRNYSQEFSFGGIHYIDNNLENKKQLLEIKDQLNYNFLGLTIKTPNEICQSLLP